MNEVFDKDMAVFSGLHTFHNIAFRKDLKDVDYAVVGVPFDTAAANRCGARFAPMAIRSFASFSNGYGWNTNLEVLGEDVQGTDLGEIAVKNGYTTPSLTAIETGLKVIYDAGVINYFQTGFNGCQRWGSITIFNGNFPQISSLYIFAKDFQVGIPAVAIAKRSKGADCHRGETCTAAVGGSGIKRNTHYCVVNIFQIFAKSYIVKCMEAGKDRHVFIEYFVHNSFPPYHLVSA